MPHFFVTGATGFIGARLVGELLRRGDVVLALSRQGKLVRPPGFSPEELPPLDHPNLRVVQGDITDAESLRRGMEGCTHVYHLAGYAKNWARDPATYTRLNVDGLRNVLDAAVINHVQRVVWTSTMLTFGPTPRGTVGDETLPRTGPPLTHYEASKIAAEKLADEYAARGVPVVTVNPGRVYGPGHLTEGNSIALIIDQYDRGRAPVLLSRGRDVGNWVFVEDIVAGLIGAMERGRAGEKYLLGGENASLAEFFRAIDQASGKRHWQITVRRPGAMIYAYTQLTAAKCLGRHPQITPDWVRVFLLDWAFTSAKAKRELGYTITPLAEGICRTYDWLMRVRAEKNQIARFPV